MSKNKHHIFVAVGKPSTLCGIPDRDGIIFNSGKKVTCKKCIKIKNEHRTK